MIKHVVYNGYNIVVTYTSLVVCILYIIPETNPFGLRPALFVGSCKNSVKESVFNENHPVFIKIRDFLMFLGRLVVGCPTVVYYPTMANPLTEYIEAPPRPSYDVSKVDQARAWMIYCGFSGGIEKTSISSKVPAAVIRSLEHDYNWPVKLSRLKRGAGESEAEKTANRAVSYLQAQRMRDITQKA